MDHPTYPDQILNDTRQASRSLTNVFAESTVEQTNIEYWAARLRDMFDYLDGWLSSGGALPREWTTDCIAQHIPRPRVK